LFLNLKRYFQEHFLVTSSFVSTTSPIHILPYSLLSLSLSLTKKAKTGVFAISSYIRQTLDSHLLNLNFAVQMSTENPCFLYLLLHLCMEIGQCSSFKVIAYFWLEYIPFIGASICSFAYMNCWQVAMKLSPNRDKFMEVISGTGDINADMEKFCTTFSPFLKENHEFLVWSPPIQDSVVLPLSCLVK
jgi:hypothetical protein